MKWKIRNHFATLGQGSRELMLMAVYDVKRLASSTTLCRFGQRFRLLTTFSDQDKEGNKIKEIKKFKVIPLNFDIVFNTIIINFYKVNVKRRFQKMDKI